jgi:hypothetical protein
VFCESSHFKHAKNIFIIKIDELLLDFQECCLHIFIYFAEFINTAAVKICKLLINKANFASMKQHGRLENCAYKYTRG